jgi:serine protease Do
MGSFKRFGLLVAILVAGAGLQAGSSVRAAGDDEKDRRIERRIEIVSGGGSFLGVSIGDVGRDDVAAKKLHDERGVIVKSVEADSPAAKAGLAEGDVILSYAGEPVRSVAQFRRLVRETPGGRAVSLEVSRDGATRTVTATLERRRGVVWNGGDEGDWNTFLAPPEAPEPPEPPEPPDAPRAPRQHREFRFALPDAEAFAWRGLRRSDRPKLGLRYQEVSGQFADYLKIGSSSGVVVTHVDPEGPAGKAGIKAGDVLAKVGTTKVEDGASLRDALDDVKPGQDVTVTVRRGGQTLDLHVTAGGERRAGRTRL